jgi:hypothetical protein
MMTSAARDKVFAHNGLPDVNTVHDLLAMTSIDEIKDISGPSRTLEGARRRGD